MVCFEIDSFSIAEVEFEDELRTKAEVKGSIDLIVAPSK